MAGHFPKKSFSLALALSLSAALAAVSALAQQKEHPKEHPQSAKKLSTDDLDAAIRAHIEEKSKASDGRFEVRDDVLNKTWSLELVRVHKDKLQALADGRYFACVDFKAPDATMVDVDFFLKKDGDKLAVTDTTVHKIDGKARYNYEEKNGVWVRVADKS
ncbi:MAG: hypothetical protein DMF54_12840 [Acidobacteria bacterium]|nr:MAG: hypothetical protein DMF54_12840 [Acidobacteriota bacterium]